MGRVVESGVALCRVCRGGGRAPSSTPSCLGRRHQSRVCEAALPSWLPHAAFASSGLPSSATAWAPQADLLGRGRRRWQTSHSSRARPRRNRQPPALPAQLQLHPFRPWSPASGTRSKRETSSVSVHLQGEVGCGVRGAAASAERLGHRARGGEGSEEGRVTGSGLQQMAPQRRASSLAASQSKLLAHLKITRRRRAQRWVPSSAGLGDQLVAGGLEGAERARHAACDVLCSMRLAQVHGERTYDAT